MRKTSFYLVQKFLYLVVCDQAFLTQRLRSGVPGLPFVKYEWPADDDRPLALKDLQLLLDQSLRTMPDVAQGYTTVTGGKAYDHTGTVEVQEFLPGGRYFVTGMMGGGHVKRTMNGKLMLTACLGKTPKDEPKFKRGPTTYAITPE